MAEEAEPAEKFETWAIVELMGHIRLGGRVTEEVRFGTTMGRIDIPGEKDGEFVATQYFGGASVYRVTPCDEATARKVAEAARPRPPSQFSLPHYDDFEGIEGDIDG